MRLPTATRLGQSLSADAHSLVHYMKQSAKSNGVAVLILEDERGLARSLTARQFVQRLDEQLPSFA